MCSKTCNGGHKSRSRTCTNPPPEFGGRNCRRLGSATQSQRCSTQNCPGDNFFHFSFFFIQLARMPVIAKAASYNCVLRCSFSNGFHETRHRLIRNLGVFVHYRQYEHLFIIFIAIIFFGPSMLSRNNARKGHFQVRIHQATLHLLTKYMI